MIRLLQQQGPLKPQVEHIKSAHTQPISVVDLRSVGPAGGREPSDTKKISLKNYY